MRKRNYKKPIAYILILVLLIAMTGGPALAKSESGTVGELSASYIPATGKVTMTGTASGIESSIVVIELLKPGGALLYFGTAKLDGLKQGNFSDNITVGVLDSGTYTVRAADYDGGEYASTTFTVSSSRGGGSSGGGASLPTVVTPPALTTPSSDPGKYYNDIPSSYSWAAVAINGLTEQGAISGIGNKAYGPSNNIRRGDFVLMLVKAYGFTGTGNGNFGDVPSGSYYADAIAVAKAISLASGDGMSFYPQNSLSRQDAMVLLYRSMTLKGISLPAGAASDLSAFSDSGKVTEYAQLPVAALVKAGIIKGSGGKLNPHATITRAEMAVMLYQALQVK